MQNTRINDLIAILRCPKTGSCLRLEHDVLVSEAGERYPIVNGKPILVRQIQPLHVRPPEDKVISQNIGHYDPPKEIAHTTDFKLHLGSGNVPCADPMVVSMDILPNVHVDVVAEAEFLPFADNSFSWVESGAVFEHLYDPIAAIKEVRRVLAPGGRMYTDTAFMQGYHGFPVHFFNMTPQAVETFLVDDFELEQSHTPLTGSPGMAVEALVRKFLEALPLFERVEFQSNSVQYLLDQLSTQERREQIFFRMSEHIKRSLAASFCIIAKKPFDYESRKSVTIESVGGERFSRVKRDFYAAREGVIQRFHEVEFYRGRVAEVIVPTADTGIPRPLDSILKACHPRDSLNHDDWVKSTASLLAADAELTSRRDSWIRQYMVVAPRIPEVERNVSSRLGQVTKLKNAVKRFLKRSSVYG